MNSVALGARFAFGRLGVRWLGGAAITAVLLCILGVLVERRAHLGFATDYALVGTTFGLVVPLLAFAVLRRILPARADLALGPLARLGANRRQALLGVLVTSGAVLAIMGALLGTVTLLAGTKTEGLASDIATTSWIGGLGGVGYGVWFLCSSTWGRKAQGRLYALIFDFLFGSMTGALALPAPRAHLRNLLGGSAPLEMPQFGATICLLVLCAMLTAWTLLRTER